MALRNQGAQVHAGVLGPSQLETPRPLAQRRDEALEDGPLHIDALGAQADLPRVVERGTGDARHGAVEVGGREDDARGLAAQLERHGPHAYRRRLHDGLAGTGFAREAESGPTPCPTL
ncbi:hypothetical protein G6F31_020909 [Rhizopus arrhizus]|nr:hypothetical protein G6F31_020909 [Rhizopus arrhizus]